MTTILVTGCAGFIGHATTKALLERGDTVVGIDNLNDYYDPDLKQARLEDIRKLPNAKNFTFYTTDITDKESIHDICTMHHFDKICHFAAQAGVRYSLENPYTYEANNSLGTLILLEACRHHNIKDFVFASSSSVYGNNKKLPFAEEDRTDTPISLYAATKKANELYAYAYHHLFGINCIGLRFFTVYGPWGRPDMALFLFTKAIDNNEPIKVFNEGKMKRNFTYITDIVAGVLGAVDHPQPYAIVNLGANQTTELLHYIECIEQALGKKADKKLLPLQPGDVPDTVADIAKAKKLFGFNPQVTVEQGIPQFITWYKSYYAQ